jgi:ribosome-associated translation inhibitor RaiA
LKAPLHVRFHGVDISDAFVERARDRIDRKLARFSNVGRVTVRVEDQNGPKGGVDMLCRIKVVVPSGATIVAEAQGTDVYFAFDAALKSAVRSLSDVHSRRVRGRADAR